MVQKTNNYVIKTERLTKYYGRTRGIEDLSLSIEEGEVFGFLGPNGAGKTTTIRLLMGLLFPTSGKSFVFGLNTVAESLTIRERVGYIPGDVHLYPNMTGKGLLDYLANFKPHKKPILINQLVERLNIDLSKKIREYSKGNKQKIAIVAALMHDPDLLILDEPTSGLDPVMQREFYNIVKEFKERGKAVFLSSHIMSEIEKNCQRIGIIQKGNLLTIENVETLSQKKVRYADIIFRTQIPQEIFNLDNVKLLEQHNHSLRLSVKGDINLLLKVLAKYEIEEMSLTPSSIEDTFFEYYEKEN